MFGMQLGSDLSVLAGTSGISAVLLMLAYGASADKMNIGLQKRYRNRPLGVPKADRAAAEALRSSSLAMQATMGSLYAYNLVFVLLFLAAAFVFVPAMSTFPASYNYAFSVGMPACVVFIHSLKKK
jgi:hypothetical protein